MSNEHQPQQIYLEETVKPKAPTTGQNSAQPRAAPAKTTSEEKPYVPPKKDR